jgi:hypothetical protein
MTKKDYIVLAQNFRFTVDNCKALENTQGYEAIKGVIRGLCVDLKRDNDKFNSQKFLTACGLE